MLTFVRDARLRRVVSTLFGLCFFQKRNGNGVGIFVRRIFLDFFIFCDILLLTESFFLRWGFLSAIVKDDSVIFIFLISVIS